MSTPNSKTSVAGVRGHRAYIRPSSAASKLYASLFDLAVFVAVSCLLFRALDLSPIPGPIQLSLFPLVSVLLSALQIQLLGGTIGQLLWRLRWLDSEKKPAGLLEILRGARLFETEVLGGGVRGFTLLVTFLTLSGSGWMGYEFVGRHPMLIHASTWPLEAYVPSPEKTDSQSWVIRSYYYSLGGWPSRFGNEPVLYSVPYEKGPPQQFLGRFIARWEMPNITAIFEGPKTPTIGTRSDGQSIDPALVQICLQSQWERAADLQQGEPPGFMECMKVREATLARHLREMRSVHPIEWELKWFEVGNTSLSAAERPRGFYISASGPSSIQERYVFITPKGAHQSFILNRDRSEHGEQASELFREAIRSQRVSPTLDSGRSWADHELSEIKMSGLDQVADPVEFAARVSGIQSLLISKITVEPKNFDAYFHLGGTSFLLLQRAVKMKNHEWSAIARPNLQSALKYAEDLGPLPGATGATATSPYDPRLDQLSGFWRAAQKL